MTWIYIIGYLIIGFVFTFMVEESERCPPDIVFDACPDTSDCVKCWTDWLNEEATPDD